MEGEECGWTARCWENVLEELEEEQVDLYLLHSWAQQEAFGWGHCRGMREEEHAWPGRALEPLWEVEEEEEGLTGSWECKKVGEEEGAEVPMGCPAGWGT